MFSHQKKHYQPWLQSMVWQMLFLVYIILFWFNINYYELKKLLGYLSIKYIFLSNFYYIYFTTFILIPIRSFLSNSGSHFEKLPSVSLVEQTLSSYQPVHLEPYETLLSAAPLLLKRNLEAAQCRMRLILSEKTR